MLSISEEERSYLIEVRALAINSKRQEVFVGLTYEETIFYMRYSKSAHIESTNSEEADKYLELNERHEAARMAVIFAEAELREDCSTRH